MRKVVEKTCFEGRGRGGFFLPAQVVVGRGIVGIGGVDGGVVVVVARPNSLFRNQVIFLC